ncbi:MAG: DUF4097 domain-containing protein [bacterium]|nr:DUF4097 domain-containing protein [bacterium]
MLRHRALPCTLALLPFVLATGCIMNVSNHRAVGTIDAPIADAGKIKRLTIGNSAGVIVVREAGNAGAAIKAEVLLTEDRPETDFDPAFDKHVEVVMAGDELTIKNRHDGASDHNDWQLHFEVTVPSGIALTIEQSAGTIDIQLPAARDVAVETAAGNIDIAIPVVEGQLRANASAGNVVVAVAENGPTKGCDVSCSAGNVKLTLPKEVSGQFDLATSVGNVSLASRFGIETERDITAASARGTVGQGGATFRARASAGNIVVR